MASTAPCFFLLLLATSLLAVSQAKYLTVGDSQGWRFGVNYTHLSLQNQPFYHSDSVFKFEATSGYGGRSVYLLSSLLSYVQCDFRGTKLLAGVQLKESETVFLWYWTSGSPIISPGVKAMAPIAAPAR